jgi:ATP-dependent DNA helicase RecQ
MPVLGTTATANNRVLDDVQGQLGGFETQRGPLMRESLHLQTLCLADQAERLAWLAKYVPKFSSTGIIYTLTKKDAEQVAGWLRLNGVEAHAYYSGVEAEGSQDSDSYRQHLEELLLGNGLKALVATTALGMGFDKPDLGFVIHYQAPGSIVAYYQQVGRAGRAIDRALGLMMAGREDEDIHRGTAHGRDA